jgi:hypothetical protein
MAVLLASAIILLGVMLFLSPGRPEPFLDDSGKPLAGSISEKIKVNAGRSSLAAACGTRNCQRT